MLKIYLGRPSGSSNYFTCKRFAVQTLLQSLEFVTQINLEQNIIAVWNLAQSWSISILTSILWKRDLKYLIFATYFWKCLAPGKSYYVTLCEFLAELFHFPFFYFHIHVNNTSFWLTPNGKNWLEKICMKHNRKILQHKVLQIITYVIRNFGANLKREILLNLLLLLQNL